jgi:hypothetical protein
MKVKYSFEDKIIIVFVWTVGFYEWTEWAGTQKLYSCLLIIICKRQAQKFIQNQITFWSKTNFSPSLYKPLRKVFPRNGPYISQWCKENIWAHMWIAFLSPSWSERLSIKGWTCEDPGAETSPWNLWEMQLFRPPPARDSRSEILAWSPVILFLSA